MKSILKNNGFFIGSVLADIESNFLAICKGLIKLANVNLELKGYADSTNEPTAPAENDCYLVLAAGTIWGLECEEYDIIIRTEIAWELSANKLTELNAMLRSNYFSAANISVVTPANMTAVTLQEAIDEIAAVVFPGS